VLEVVSRHLLVEGHRGGAELVCVLSLLARGGLLGALFHVGSNLGVGVEGFHGSLALEGVDLADLHVHNLEGRADNGLNFIGVDDTGDVRVGHGRGGEGVAVLHLGVDGVKLGESTLGEHDEAADVATRSELEKIEASHGASVNATEVAEGELEAGGLGFVVHNKRPLLDDVAAATHLTTTGAELLGLSAAVKVSGGTELVRRAMASEVLAML